MVAQVEAQFEIRKITVNETKYYYLLSAQDQGTATCLLDLINAPSPEASPEDKYKALKDRLIDTFGLSGAMPPWSKLFRMPRLLWPEPHC